MLSVSTAKLTQAAINSTSTNKITLQAQQYAAGKADIVKATNYDDLIAQNKTIISNSDSYYDEVVIGQEQPYPDNSNITQKEVTIRVYNGSEALPRASLKLMRYSVSTDSSVPQGTILPWYGELANIPSGFALCDGSNGTPDLRNRFLVGAGSTYKLGDKGGEEKHKLVSDELPKQTVDIDGAFLTAVNYSYSYGNSMENRGSWGNLANFDIYVRFPGSDLDLKTYNGKGNNYFLFKTLKSSFASGNDVPHENRPPYYALYYIMKL